MDAPGSGKGRLLSQVHRPRSLFRNGTSASAQRCNLSQDRPRCALCDQHGGALVFHEVMVASPTHQPLVRMIHPMTTA
jgi:hypothetical protein